MDNKKIRVLYFDDEVNNLNAFKATFRREFKIYLASNIVDARRLMKEVNFPVIIADQRMPDITGVEFFELIRDKYPDSIRILLTAYSNTEDIINAINKGHIYSYIKKPWDENELHNTIRSAFEIYTIKKRLERMVMELKRTSLEFGRFVNGISNIHSLLLSMMGMLNLAKSDESVTDPKGYLHTIESNLRQGEKYLQLSLDYYNDSRKQNAREAVYFGPLFKNVSDALSEEIGRELNFQMDVTQEVVFLGDLFRIKFIVDQLLSVFIRLQHDEASPVSFQIKIEVSPEKADIWFNNPGTLISKEELDRLVKANHLFTEGTKEENRINFYLIREAVENMDGEIYVSWPNPSEAQIKIVIPNATDD